MNLVKRNITWSEYLEGLATLSAGLLATGSFNNPADDTEVCNRAVGLLDKLMQAAADHIEEQEEHRHL
jgi:hypothetical protein